MKSLLAGVLAVLAFAAVPARAERVTLPLNGTWQIGTAWPRSPRRRPSGRRWPCPGSSTTRHRRSRTWTPSTAWSSWPTRSRRSACPSRRAWRAPGVSRQKRNYFWYRRTFAAPARKAVATLRVNKAQFGTAVWLNGRKVGEYAGCFSAGLFDLTPAMKWAGENVLLVRIGAHPGVLPRDVPGRHRLREAEVDAGHLRRGVARARGLPRDRQRPGRAADRRVRDPGRDDGCATAGPFPSPSSWGTPSPAWKGGDRRRGRPAAEAVTLAAGEAKAVRQTIAVRRPGSGRPEDPFLYVLDTTTGGDSTDHPLRHAGVPLRHRHEARLPERPALLRARVEHHAAPLLRGPRVGRSARGTRRGSAGCWSTCRRSCTGTPSASASARCPTSGWTSPTRRACSIQNEFFVWTGDPTWPQWPDRTLRRAGDDPPVLGLDARQLEPPERRGVGREQRDAGRRVRRPDHPGRAAARPVEPQLGEQLQPAGRARRPRRGPPVPHVRRGDGRRARSR